MSGSTSPGRTSKRAACSPSKGFDEEERGAPGSDCTYQPPNPASKVALNRTLAGRLRGRGRWGRGRFRSLDWGWFGFGAEARRAQVQALAGGSGAGAGLGGGSGAGCGAGVAIRASGRRGVGVSRARPPEPSRSRSAAGPARPRAGAAPPPGFGRRGARRRAMRRDTFMRRWALRFSSSAVRGPWVHQPSLRRPHGARCPCVPEKPVASANRQEASSMSARARAPIKNRLDSLRLVDQTQHVASPQARLPARPARADAPLPV